MAKQHELIYDSGCSLTQYNLRYLIDIPDISIEDSIDSLLHPTVHEDIVERAVTLAYNDIVQMMNKEQKTFNINRQQ
jgi:hypothetical protein